MMRIKEKFLPPFLPSSVYFHKEAELSGYWSHWRKTAAAAAKSLQSCLTLCTPIDGSPPGSAIPGILQAKTLEWVAISFSSAWKWKVQVKSLSRVRLLATPWTAAYQAPPSIAFARQESTGVGCHCLLQGRKASRSFKNLYFCNNFRVLEEIKLTTEKKKK